MTCWLCGFETTELVTNAKAPTCDNAPCRICEEVANVDKEINEAVATLQCLLAKRCDLRSKQNRVHGTLFHRLPVELKNYIFELVVSGTSRNKWDEIPRMTRMTRNEGPRWTFLPSHLASVCRSWRDIAWSNPVFWSTMHIDITHASVFDPVRRTNIVQDWVQRSRTLPLTLHIVGHRVGGSEEGLKDVIDVINQCSHRWHSLSLNLPFELLRTFQHNNFQLCPLRKLRLTTRETLPNDIDLPVLLLSTVSPEEIELCGIPSQSLQISWNQLTSATIKDCDLEGVTQLLRQASQMAHCRIFSLSDHRNSPLPMPPIIHQRIKTLGLCYGRHQDAARLFLDSLTLPYLQEFHTTEMFPLKYLPALVHRSSCPLTRITFELTPGRGGYREWGLFDGFQPLLGVTDLVVEKVEGRPQVVEIKRLLLKEYFPDLRHFILRLEPFRFFWDEGIIPELLVRERLHQGAAAKGRQRKILIIDQRRVHEFNDLVWKSPIGTKLKELQVDVSFREDGFEILIPT